MTSAALHSVPHQSASTVANPSVAALSSGRSYSSSRPQTRESYFSSPTNASPSARRSSRKSSAGNAVPTTHKPSQSSHRVSVSSPSPSASSRNNILPASSMGVSTEYTTISPGDTQRGFPPVISPRTSSNRTPHNSSVLIDRSSSRRSGNREPSNSPRQAATSDSQYTRDRSKGNQSTPQSHWTNEDRSAATPKTRRRHVSQGEASPDPSIENRERKAATMSTGRRKVGTPVGTYTPTGPSREASEVLNRIIISHPEEDIERERERMAEAIPVSKGTPVSATANDNGVNSSTRGTRSRHDYTASTTKREKNIKFGEYFLGGTLGEGEFGKVKMGWKKEGGVQVAIKLIRRDNVGANPSRLAKIHREIAILEGISHPNIVRLHEMVQTEKQIGIILEYASGGELFDYILNHRYLNDNAARRLFAQLVSGVGYLHNKGIVHRDLKLENLLLDRNRNIIITDFGFANTFNAEDELGEEIEYNLTNKDFVKKLELDKLLPNGHRRGDLMQTSCGSPCYAAPELVVSDSLYTGRKVDVWSCGVILYAMLAGYLPFDDDPANPEGDNINLLYKYIVSTPLTFPDYVSPHARDLLRRILVPDPRKRADLFEVARHSWLAEYAHIVSFITSRATTGQEISSTAIHKDGHQDTSMISRSASVRESSKNPKSTTTNGELPRKYGKTDLEINESRKTSKDNKRRTVQVEYVAPRSQTQRGPHASGTSNGPTQTGSKRRVRSGSHTPAGSTTSEKPNLHESCKENTSTTHGRRPSTANRSQNTSQAIRREPPHSTSETVHHISSQPHPPVSLTRPATGGSIKSSGSRPASMHLTSKGSYSQPVAPELAGTNVQGRMAQPKNGKINYAQPVEVEPDSRRGSFIGRALSRLDKVQGDSDAVSRHTLEVKDTKGHRRSNTIGGFFSRTNSVFGVGGGRRGSEEKSSKKYPPVSMSGSTIAKEDNPRLSVDSRRSISFGFGRKRSGSISKSHTNVSYDKPQRFSLIPTTFSLKAIGIGKDGSSFDADYRPKNINDKHEYTEQHRTSYLPSMKLHSSTGTTTPISFVDGQFERSSENLNPSNQSAFSVLNEQSINHQSVQQQNPPLAFRSGRVNEPESSIMEAINNHRGELIESERSSLSQQNHQKGINGRGMLQKNNRRFADAYEQELSKGYGTNHSDHGGSSGAARKVMDFFRRRGRDRAL
ncbi:putative serine threonine protein kinase [Erysiphe neolycopersici]|uniref:Serine/threonine-protein kinase ATG1 n=1 Tax=Erysiphe neolycopersici TaxID=212602 RepID=A0A420HPC4_9PEZI|nr:putative serine threonine protein kinase [Erysiphe neolycopersici]